MVNLIFSFSPLSRLMQIIMVCLVLQPSVSLYGQDKATDDEEIDLVELRGAFLAAPDFPERFNRLHELEQQALVLVADEPLKLGSIGAAILDIYHGSQTGHFVMRRYYEHLEVSDAALDHQRWLDLIQANMRGTGAGTLANPYQIMTKADAATYAQNNDNSPVGSIYQGTEAAHLAYLLVTRPETGKLRQMYFDLSHIISGLIPESEESAHKDNPWPVIRLFATQSDTAAQTAIGAYLAQARKYDEAVGWLKVASRSGNILANSLLARIYWTQSESADSDTQRDELRDLSLENHLHAIALGSTESMYTLANLYLADLYGEENRLAALPLLEQSADLGHTDSLIYLGHIYSTGRFVEQDLKRAETYFARAAQLEDPSAVLRYGRFLTANDIQVNADNQVTTWLRDLTRDNNAEAMVVMGNLFARGLVPKASKRKAISWYKKAVRKAPVDPDIVNEVAWTLAVSDIKGLQRGKYARRIMNHLMEKVDEARTRPEYLDTWAATYAATDQFERAVELQQEAIDSATEQARDDVMEILQTHMDLFRTQTKVTERAP